jgi:hypothetical protein
MHDDFDADDEEEFHLGAADDFYADEDEEFHAAAADDFYAGETNHADQPVVYEVYNPEQTVGVVCDREGVVIGMHIDDEILYEGDDVVAATIRRVAALAHQKSRVGLRAEMERNGTDAVTLGSFGLPTQKDYLAMENAEFGIAPKPEV